MTVADEAAKLGHNLMESGLQSFAHLSKGTQAIADEAASFAKASYESGATALEMLASSASIEEAIRIQAEYAKSAYQRMVAGTSTFTSLYADVAKGAYAPFESIAVKAK